MRQNDLTEFGVWVKRNLLEMGMTQRKLSKEVGIDERFLSMILYGIRPGYEHRDRIKEVIEKQSTGIKKIKTA